MQVTDLCCHLQEIVKLGTRHQCSSSERANVGYRILCNKVLEVEINLPL
jgi:hypothetical protein